MLDMFHRGGYKQIGKQTNKQKNESVRVWEKTVKVDLSANTEGTRGNNVQHPTPPRSACHIHNHGNTHKIQ